jgi:two-component system, chemotaxis family, protein-glutamate methylesterase/glutaminase
MENLPKEEPLKTGAYGAVAVGVSAGGLAALESILGRLPADFYPALMIVQHLHPQQCDYLVGHLNAVCRLPVKEAEEKDVIECGNVYLAPANYHLLVETDKTFSLSTDEKVNYSRPSIDVLFETAAEAYGAELIGVILTGASRDGAAGLRRIKEAAGLTIVQDPASAEFPVMPQAAVEASQADHVLNIEGIGALLCELGRPVPPRMAIPGRKKHG